LRRAYPDTNPDIVWQVAKHDLAALQLLAERIICEEDAKSLRQGVRN